MIAVVLFTLFGIHGLGAGMMLNLGGLYWLDRRLERRDQRRYEASEWGQARRAA